MHETARVRPSLADVLSARSGPGKTLSRASLRAPAPGALVDSRTRGASSLRTLAGKIKRTGTPFGVPVLFKLPRPGSPSSAQLPASRFRAAVGRWRRASVRAFPRSARRGRPFEPGLEKKRSETTFGDLGPLSSPARVRTRDPVVNSRLGASDRVEYLQIAYKELHLLSNSAK